MSTTTLPPLNQLSPLAEPPPVMLMVPPPMMGGVLEPLTTVPSKIEAFPAAQSG
jgi:hypothetical protein